jgi:hypothetical protein
MRKPKPTRSMARMWMEKLYCSTCRKPLSASWPDASAAKAEAEVKNRSIATLRVSFIFMIISLLITIPFFSRWLVFADAGKFVAGCFRGQAPVFVAATRQSAAH